MGSKSDWETMRHACDMLARFGISHERRVLSAHRTPDATADYVKAARQRGLRVIIAAAGGAAHLAGVVASHTTLPVLGVPMKGWRSTGWTPCWPRCRCRVASRWPPSPLARPEP